MKASSPKPQALPDLSTVPPGRPPHLSTVSSNFSFSCSRILRVKLSLSVLVFVLVALLSRLLPAPFRLCSAAPSKLALRPYSKGTLRALEMLGGFTDGLGSALPLVDNEGPGRLELDESGNDDDTVLTSPLLPNQRRLRCFKLLWPSLPGFPFSSFGFTSDVAEMDVIFSKGGVGGGVISVLGDTSTSSASRHHLRRRV